MVGTFRDWFLDQLAMYSAYHKDKRNQLTHYVGVPLIVFSILIVLAEPQLGRFLSGSGVILAVMLTAYIVAVPVVGVLSVVAYVPLLVAAEAVAASDASTPWSVAGASFVAGWAIQFWGHIFEGRRPAFMTNILQIFMAPAFLVAEGLFAAGLQRPLCDLLQSRAQKYARS